MFSALILPLLLAALGAGGAVLLGALAARWRDQRSSARQARKDADAGPTRWLDDGALGGGRGLSPELLNEVRRIHIRTGHRVNEVMAGEYKSTFKGRGMEFEEVREYVPGDDVRTIDWNVTARMQRPFVKEFREERELVVMILVDISASGDFGTKGSTKNAAAAQLAATLAFAAVRNNDKVGLLLFTDRVERFVPPKKGRGHVWRVIKEILDSERRGAGTDLGQALSFLGKVVRRKAVVFLISDFLQDSDALEMPLRLVQRRHDLVAFQISDPRERSLPDVGFLALQDAETGATAWVDTASAGVRGHFAKRAEARREALRGRLRRLGVDLVLISTGEGVSAPLNRYFRQRDRSAR